MKQPVQVVIAVVILLATVGGVAFLRNWVTTPTPDGSGGGPIDHGIAVHFPVTVIEESREFELNGKGYQNFRFENSNDTAVELGLGGKSCKCSKVEAIALSEEDEKRLAALDAKETQTVLDGRTDWQALDDDGAGNVKTLSVRPHGVGFVRMSWEAKPLGPARLTADIWARESGQPKTRGPGKTLAVPITVVNPIQISATKIDVPDITFGQSQFGDFYCFSTTRPNFKVTSVTEKSGDPCFVSTVTQLMGADLEQAAQTIGQDPKRLAALHRVRVEVRERSPDGKAVLDLGPYQRELELSTDEKNHPPLIISVNGTVRGDVTVGTEESQDRVLLKTFPSNKGKEVTIPIEATGTKPKDVKVTPEYIKAELTPDGNEQNRWKLKVTVPPRMLRGKVPDDGAVLIELDNGRRLRIPIVGRATIPIESQ